MDEKEMRIMKAYVSLTDIQHAEAVRLARKKSHDDTISTLLPAVYDLLGNLVKSYLVVSKIKKPVLVAKVLE